MSENTRKQGWFYQFSKVAAELKVIENWKKFWKTSWKVIEFDKLKRGRTLKSPFKLELACCEHENSCTVF